MKTYLLTWNPDDDTEFAKTLREQTPKTLAGKRYQLGWSTGTRKQMELGSRIFIVRLGNEPKGIVGSARTISIPKLSPHRLRTKRMQGKKSVFVRCECDKLVSTELYQPLSLETLKEIEPHSFNWTPQCSGTEIPEEVAKKLEQLWYKHLAGITGITYDSISVERYIKALLHLPDKYRKIIVLQFQCPRHEVSAGQLARLAGYPTFQIANILYGHAAHLVCKALNVAKPPFGQWFAALSEAYYNGKAYIWIMRPNLVEATKQLGWPREKHYQTFFASPDELTANEEFAEGRVQLVAVNVFERNTKARAVCLRHYGFVCSVCGFDFQKFYGELGREFIHVHHVKPLSEIGEEYTVDPIKDLLPVCPNCHAMLHQKSPALAVGQLEKLIKGSHASTSSR